MIINTPVPPEVRNAFEMQAELFLREEATDERLMPDHFRKSSSGMAVFTLGLHDLEDREQDLGAAATQSGWVFLTSATGDKVSLTEVRVSERDQASKVVSLSLDPSNAETRRIMETIRGMKETQEADYELRVLRVPALGIEAFWLKARTAEKPDLVVPFLSMAREAREDQVYNAEDFLKAIRPLIPRALPRRRDKR